VYFSTKFELLESGNFSIYETDPGFKESGLDEASYLVSNYGVPVKPSFFDEGKVLGVITGDLKRRIEDWWGEPIG